MPALEITALQRITLTLAPERVLERLILNRLAGFSRTRGRDWLRSLLVHGFVAEGKWMRAETRQRNAAAEPPFAAMPDTDYARWLCLSRRGPRQAPFLAAVSAVQPRNATLQADASKPFAHLRKVVG